MGGVIRIDATPRPREELNLSFFLRGEAVLGTWADTPGPTNRSDYRAGRRRHHKRGWPRVSRSNGPSKRTPSIASSGRGSLRGGPSGALRLSWRLVQACATISDHAKDRGARSAGPGAISDSKSVPPSTVTKNLGNRYQNLLAAKRKRAILVVQQHFGVGESQNVDRRGVMEEWRR